MNRQNLQMAEVRSLRFLHRSLPRRGQETLGSVSASLPWNSLPHSMQTTLQGLDRDGNGELTVSPTRDSTYDPHAEINFSNQTANTLSRLFWAYSGPSPFNQSVLDASSLDQRRQQMGTLNLAIYQNVVQPLLADRSNPERWQDAERSLFLTASAGFLYQLGDRAFQEARQHTSERDVYRNLLDTSEQLLLSALRFSSRIPWRYDFFGPLGYTQGEPTIWGPIDRTLSELNPLIDSLEDAEFQFDRTHPYPLATMGTPVTGDLASLARGEVTFEMAIPASFLAHSQNPLEQQRAVRHYLNEVAHIRIRPSVFNGDSSQEYRLIANGVHPDLPGPHDDPIDLQCSFHPNQRTLNRILFGENTRYFRVSFHFRNEEEARAALGSRLIRKFDLVMDRPLSQHRGSLPLRTQTVFPGSFVLQNMQNKTTRTAVSSDIHMSDDDFRLLPETLRHMEESFSLHPENRQLRDQMERFYQSVNERVLATVEQWNIQYARGDIHRVIIAGDLVNYLNHLLTLADLGYRDTHVRQLVWILSQVHAPLYVTKGNHDFHRRQYPHSVECRYFRRLPGLCASFENYYDRFHFPEPLLVAAVLSLIPASYHLGNDTLEGLARAFTQAYRTDPYRNRDETSPHLLQRFAINENYGVGIGNFRYYFVETGPEDFSYLSYLLTGVQAPRGRHVLRALRQYVSGHQVNGRGPTQEEFVTMIYEIQATQLARQFFIPFLHYPIFGDGWGPDDTPRNADTLRDPVARAFRLAFWHFTYEDGRPVVPIAIAGHRHEYSETTMEVSLTNASDYEQLHKEIEAVLMGLDPLPLDTLDERMQQVRMIRQASFIDGILRYDALPYIPITDPDAVDGIYDRMNDIWERWHLSTHTFIRGMDRPGREGVPTPMARGLWENPSYGQVRGTLYVNIPALGPESTRGNGYMILTTDPTGRVEMEMRYIRLTPDGRVIERNGRDLNSFLREERRELGDWNTSLQPAESPISDQPTRLRYESGNGSNSHLFVDWFPLVCQYPRGETCVNILARGGYNLTTGEWSVPFGFGLEVPLSNRSGPFLTFLPNSAFLDLTYDPVHGDFRARGGTHHGIFSPFVGLGRISRQDAFLDAGLMINHNLPRFPFLLPDVGCSVGSHILHGGTEFMCFLEWSTPLVSIGREHQHSR